MYDTIRCSVCLQGLSGGATAGIVIAILVLIIVMVVVIVGFLWKRKRLPHPSFRYKKVG